jgi:hypothetical protein
VYGACLDIGAVDSLIKMAFKEKYAKWREKGAVVKAEQSNARRKP